MARYRVEELASSAGVAVDTVRYYQRRRLLHPPARAGRLAFYDDGHLARVREIRTLAEQGFTLAQIGALADERDARTTDGHSHQTGRPDGKDERAGAGGSGHEALLAELAARHAADPDLDRSELARRADVPEFIVDLVVSAGLLVPAGEHGDRFPADAVDMLVAARTLVSEGVSLEELTALAVRHATHVEDVVDDAIELFKRHNDRRGGDRDHLIALVHRLVPVASDLVSRHFERTLRARALARMGGTTGTGGTDALAGGLVVLARRLDDRLDPIAVHAAATDHRRALWMRPDRRFALVALGAVEVIAPTGRDRFSAASAARAALAARVHRSGPADAPAPVLVGGFSFGLAADRADRGPDWTGFPDASWILPALTVIDRPDGTWVLAAGRVGRAFGPEDVDTTGTIGASAGLSTFAGLSGSAGVATGLDEGATIDALDHAIDTLIAGPPAPLVFDPGYRDGEIRVDDATAASYEALVAEALASIDAGRLDKVVLARTHEESGVDPVPVLARLRDRYPGCAVFSFAVGDRTFIGASPEQLVALDGREIRTDAVAGTTGVGSDETADRELAAGMLASPKIRAEHAFVVDDITARLATLGLVGETPDEPAVLRLARLQHLRTPITARIERRAGGVSDMDVLRVAGVLHPTPAVAGTPTDAAVAWIEVRESFERGWYAAPVGWCDLDGNGELWVALRSALLDTSAESAVLFSGAGIVADSVPAEELAETGVKFRALLDVMER